MVLDRKTGALKEDVKYKQDLSGLTKAIVTSIENYEIKCGDEIIKIDTVEKLYNTVGVSPVLIAQIEGAMLNSSPEVDADFLAKP
jgi:hypothetical protein